jgi:hypothetical protein
MSELSLARRLPGESLMEVLRQELCGVSAPSFADRLFGRHPVPSAARSWYIGLQGEREVAQRLSSLPDGWLVVHSVPVGERGSDIDHVLVSPSGRVLTLNTKHSPRGKVWVSPKTIYVNGHRQPYLRNSIHEAARAAKLLTVATGEIVDTLAVIVVVGAKLTRKGEPDGVAVVTIDQLIRFLTHTAGTSQHHVSVESVQHAVLQPKTWALTPPAVSGSKSNEEWFTHLSVRIRAAARRRGLWGLTIVCAIAGLSASVLHAR